MPPSGPPIARRAGVLADTSLILKEAPRHEPPDYLHGAGNPPVK